MSWFLEQISLRESSQVTNSSLFGPLRSVPTASEKIDVIAVVFAPVFVIFILLEAVWIQLKGQKKAQSLADSTTSIASGLLQALWNRNVKSGLVLLAYAYVYEHYRLFEPPLDSWLCAFAFFLVLDLAYYWGHRWSHESTLIWSGHNVHHSSEFYNFTTALRQGVFEAIFSYPRNLLWAALGFPPLYWLTWYEINVAFMFFVHTEQVGKLWWPIELVFNTPSHHRVHHARNPKYIDKNYAGIFIIWDRLFGTFEPEAEKCVYGLVHPLHTIDPLQVQFSHLKHVIGQVSQQRTLAAKLGSAVYGPGWFWDEKSRKWREHELPAVVADASVELDIGVNTRRFPLLKLYAFVQFALFMGVGTVCLSWNPQPAWQFAVAALLLTYSAVVIAGLFSTRDAHEAEKRDDAPVLGAMLLWRAGGDVRQWVRRAETARWLVIAGVVAFVLPVDVALRNAVLGVAVVSVAAAFAATIGAADADAPGVESKKRK